MRVDLLAKLWALNRAFAGVKETPPSHASTAPKMRLYNECTSA